MDVLIFPISPKINRPTADDLLRLSPAKDRHTASEILKSTLGRYVKHHDVWRRSFWLDYIKEKCP